MLTQNRKLHSVFILPEGREFVGTFTFGKSEYQLTFSPFASGLTEGRLWLEGSLSIKAPNGRVRTVKEATARLLSTQGSITAPPPAPRFIDSSLEQEKDQPEGNLPVTDWTGPTSSVATMYMRLSNLNGRGLNVPMDMSETQLNIRMFTKSTMESDLHWLYSQLILTAMGEKPDSEKAARYISEINRILKI